MENMTEYIMITENHNWADEFDIYGFTIMSKNEWNSIKEEINDLNLRDREFYFGTNEYLQWNTGKDFLRNCSEKEISFEDYKSLIKIFTSNKSDLQMINFIQNKYWIEFGYTFINRVIELDDEDDEEDFDIL